MHEILSYTTVLRLAGRVVFHYKVYVYIYIQSVSRLVDITAVGDFLGLCDQKS